MPVIYLRCYLENQMSEKKMRKFKGIDATSSPGNKTLQLSEFIGKVHSFELDSKRYEIL